MDFLGIGPLELVLILILGFLFFGPEKLPGMAAKAGKLYRNFRKATSDLGKTISEDISKEVKLEEKTTVLSEPEPGEKTIPASTQIENPTSKPDEKLNE